MKLRRWISSSIPRLPQRRVVVTGLGAVSPLGLNAETSWQNVTEGRSGIGRDERDLHDNASGLPRLVARIPPSFQEDIGEGLESEIGSSVKGVRCILYALAAAEEAFRDARLNPADADVEWKNRAGVCVGTGIGSIDIIADAAKLIESKPRAYRRLSPYFVPRTLANLAAGHISMRHDLRGPNHACANACATGANSIGDAYRMIQRGDADTMVAGGTESCVHAISVAGFKQMRALGADSTATSRPFDRDRTGFVMGEGAAVLLLESLDHALDRGAQIYAEIRGYGMSADAHHVSAPSPDGNGAYRCMIGALNGSGVSVDEIDYINAHATSTPVGDEIEARAMSRFLRESSSRTLISSTKGATGHLLGAAGALEALFAVLAVRRNTIPPTLNVENVCDSISPLGLSIVGSSGVFQGGRLVTEEHETRSPIRAALSNSFGFGGTNASLLFASHGT